MLISIQQLSVFFLIVARIAGVFIEMPFFSSRSFPVFIKTAVVIWISLLLWFVVPINNILPNSFVEFIFALLLEASIGFLIGFVCNIFFHAIQGAGEIMDMQMGLSVASALDPAFGMVVSIIGKLAFMFAMIIFLSINGHHMLLSALHQSFVAIPVGHIPNFASPKLVQQVISLGTSFWSIAIILAAPIVLLIFLSDFSFGIVSRVAPQVNVFMLGFQVKPMLGLFGFLLCMPFIVTYLNKILEFMLTQMLLLAKFL
ncbi:MAG: flagellar biosynthetic protein FliR [Candidatus Margulisiibacteriota bacterium]